MGLTWQIAKNFQLMLKNCTRNGIQNRRSQSQSLIIE